MARAPENRRPDGARSVAELRVRREEVHTHPAELTGGFPDLELVVSRRITVPAAIFYRFDGERMLNETVYFDRATMMRQFGLSELAL